MAYYQQRPPNVNFTNSLKAAQPYGNDGVHSGAGLNTPLNYTSVQALRNALNGANAAYYTFARLDTMTVNDMVFALRHMQDATTIASYLTNAAA